MTTVKYLDPTTIIAKRQTKAPLNRSRTGYGNKLPTSWQLQLNDKRWRRVYVICWSNSGSAYVLVNGELLFLGPYDPNFDSYYTVVIPYEEDDAKRTIWHPSKDAKGSVFETLTRGAFKTENEGHEWARAKLGNSNYSVKHIV